jgi:hypothetical protein
MAAFFQHPALAVVLLTLFGVASLVVHIIAIWPISLLLSLLSFVAACAIVARARWAWLVVCPISIDLFISAAAEIWPPLKTWLVANVADDYMWRGGPFGLPVLIGASYVLYVAVVAARVRQSREASSSRGSGRA